MLEVLFAGLGCVLIAGVFIDLISPEAGYIFAAGVALLMVAAAYVVRAFRRRGRARV